MVALLELGRLRGVKTAVVEDPVDDQQVGRLVGDDRRVAHAVLVDQRQLAETLARICGT